MSLHIRICCPASLHMNKTSKNKCRQILIFLTCMKKQQLWILIDPHFTTAQLLHQGGHVGSSNLLLKPLQLIEISSALWCCAVHELVGYCSRHETWWKELEKGKGHVFKILGWEFTFHTYNNLLPILIKFKQHCG